jgi:nitrogen-specific signal transduction histidine kinase
MGKNQPKWQKVFLHRVLLVLLVIMILSGIVQFFLLQHQVKSELEHRSELILNTISREIEKSERASQLIEHQIDLNLYAFARNIEQELKSQSVEEMTNEQLENIRKELQIAGITIFAQKGNDIVGIKSTDPVEIGLSTKAFHFFTYANALLNEERIQVNEASFVDDQMIVMPIIQSTSHSEEKVFYKYGYYHPKGKDYIICLFIEAEDVKKFTDSIHPNVTIEKILNEDPYIKEVAVFDISNQQMNVIAGLFHLKSKEDRQMVEQRNIGEKISYLDSTHSEDVFKVFYPIPQDRMIYVALDYQRMRQSLMIHSFLMASTGMIALLCLYFLIRRLFQQISNQMNKIVEKVKRISKGDYYLLIDFDEQPYEFRELAQSINKMSLNLRQSFERIIHEKQFREEILSSIPVGIITVNQRTNEMEVNKTAKELLNLNEERMKLVSQYLYLDEKNEAIWNWFYSNEFFHTRKTKIVRGDETYTVLVSQTPLMNKKGERIGKIFYFIDVSEFHRLERKVANMEKLATIGELATGAAHEIKNPLTVIQGFMTLLQHQMSDEENEKYRIPLILKEIDRMNDIVNDMLMLAKPKRLNLEYVSLKQIIDEMLPLLDDQVQNRISIEVDVDPSIMIDADIDRLKQVFLNIIMNSIQAIEGQGKIDIVAKVDDRFVQIFIKDTGKGIPREWLDKIFEPFVSTKEYGTGLGLTIIQRIIDSHGGDIQVVETGPSGTVFQIQLPLSQDIVTAQP